MKIIVCVKQVPATNEVKMDPVTNTIIREGIESIINPFDTYAIEEALRIREKYGAKLASISMGIPAAAQMLRKTVALGMDEAYLLSDRAFAGADTLATAHALARGIEKVGGADLIICGKMATDGDTAQVGPMLAEMLDVPHVTDISKIEVIEGNKLSCRKLTDDGYLEVKVTMPAVITVVKEINVPRLPSVNGLLKSCITEIPVLSADDVAADKKMIGLSGSPTQVIKTFVPDLSRHCEWLEGSNAEQVTTLLKHMEEKKLVAK